MLRLTSLIFLFFVFVNAKTAEKEEATYKNPLSRGFGDDIEWVKWDDAIEKAMEVEKPIFLLIHKSWCHACLSLKKAFQQSSAQKAFTALSKYFVMVNTEDDEEPWEEEYKADGKYIPRLYFLDKNGEVLSDIKNTKAAYEKYQYYYASPAEVITAMKAVLKKFDIEVPETKKAPGMAEEAKKEEEAKGPRGPKGDAPPKKEEPAESTKSDKEPKKEEKKMKEETKEEKKETKEAKKEAKEAKESKKDAKETKETKKEDKKEPKAPSAKPPADSKPADSKPADKPADKKENKEKKAKKSEL